MKVGKWKLLHPLALMAVGATIVTSGALAKSAQTNEVRFAIMTDCKGAFAFGYEVDTAVESLCKAGRIAAQRQGKDHLLRLKRFLLERTLQGAPHHRRPVESQ